MSVSFWTHASVSPSAYYHRLLAFIQNVITEDDKNKTVSEIKQMGERDQIQMQRFLRGGATLNALGSLWAKGRR